MRRAPWVVGATGVGLGLLFSFHTKPVHVTIASPSTGSSPGPTSPTTSTGSAPTSSTSTSSGGSVGPSTTPPTTAAAIRSGTGQDIQYLYGDIQLKVTERGSAISAVDVVTEGATDPRSAEINSQAIPLLQQEAMNAQSANIDGVSGATFTSNAYAQALQSALDRVS